MSKTRQPGRFERWLRVSLFGGRVGKPLNLLSNLASIAGLLVALVALFKWDSTFIPVLYLCFLSAFLLVRYLRQERWARYAEAAPVLERAYSAVHDANEFSVFGDDYPALWRSLRVALDEFATAFTVVVGSQCRACIVEMRVQSPAPDGRKKVEPEDLLLVTVLLRSHSDGEGAEDGQPVRGNTDFLHVVQTGKAFICNDLPKEYRRRTYENTKWTPDKVEAGDIDYQSAIVWPVQVAPTASSLDALPIAFLCVDTRRTGAFIPDTDVPTGASFAHALYPTLRKLLGS